MSKPCSALGASSCKHLAAVSGSHSFHKAVLFFSVKLLRLVCSFHFFSSFCVSVFKLSGHNNPINIRLYNIYHHSVKGFFKKNYYSEEIIICRQINCQPKSKYRLTIFSLCAIINKKFQQ